MKICFAFYPLFVHYNHGIALLSALCQSRGIDVSLCMLTDTGAFLGHLDRERPNVVGFSCVTVHDYRRCVPFLRAAKGAGYFVLLGGVWAGLGHPVDDAVDFVCRGDGETLPDFLLHGDTRLFEERMVCRDIHNLPLPDYDLFRDIPFDRGLPFLQGKRVLPYYSSRGCAGRCSFCQVRHQPRGVRVRARVREDLTALAPYGADLYFMGDAALPHDSPSWRASWGDFRHPFFAYIRADIPAGTLAWLIDRGMVACAFGVESGDEMYRNRVLHKGLTDAELWRTVGILDRHGVDMLAFFMTGTPGETDQARESTAAMMRHLPGLSVAFAYENLGVCQ